MQRARRRGEAQARRGSSGTATRSATPPGRTYPPSVHICNSKAFAIAGAESVRSRETQSLSSPESAGQNNASLRSDYR